MNIIKELCDDPNLSISIICLRSKRKNFADDYSIKFKEIGIDNIVYLDKFSTPIAKVLFLNKITKRADVIHSHGFFPDCYLSLIITNAKKISTAHCIFMQDYQLTYGKLKGLLLAFLHHFVYLNPSFDFLVGCSDNVASYLRRTNYFNKSKVDSIQNGVNTKTFFKLSPEIKLLKKRNLFKKFKISHDISSDIYVYSGGLTRRKRVPELIDCFSKLPCSQNLLFILGDGEEREICEIAAKNKNNIYFLGFVNETRSWYQVADYVISNSMLEGFPMSILEGIACGCKALLSDIPAHQEMIEIFPNSATLLTSTVFKKNFLNSTKDELEYLSSARMSRQYLDLYCNKL